MKKKKKEKEENEKIIRVVLLLNYSVPNNMERGKYIFFI